MRKDMHFITEKTTIRFKYDINQVLSSAKQFTRKCFKWQGFHFYSCIERSWKKSPSRLISGMLNWTFCPAYLTVTTRLDPTKRWRRPITVTWRIDPCWRHFKLGTKLFDSHSEFYLDKCRFIDEFMNLGVF